MKKEKIPFKVRLARFLQTHNGPDALGSCLLWLAILLAFINLFVGWPYMGIPQLLLVALYLFRFFSKNKEKRQKENRRFLAFFAAFGRFFKRSRNRFRYRKTHIYRRCPHCKKHLRLPRIAGEHSVVCPVCSRRFSVKVK